jgi:uncharacterized protein YecE (DUF72 family)
VGHHGRVRIGTSGYQYDHWRGRLYPRKLPRREWLAHYASHFDSVEINNTFYGLPEAETFTAWRAQTPRGFCFALKFSRYGSHTRRLRDPAATIGRFFERARELGSALGPILLQLPPRWHADPERLDAFLSASPRRLRWAVEFRDPSWLIEPVFAVLRRHRAALCIHDLLDDHPRQVTARFVYLRFHGPASGARYPSQRLVAEARRIRSWVARRLDVYAYFNNDVGGHAVEDARDLGRYLSRRSPLSLH